MQAYMYSVWQTCKNLTQPTSHGDGHLQIRAQTCSLAAEMTTTVPRTTPSVQAPTPRFNTSRPRRSGAARHPVTLTFALAHVNPSTKHVRGRKKPRTCEHHLRARARDRTAVLQSALVPTWRCHSALPMPLPPHHWRYRMGTASHRGSASRAAADAAPRAAAREPPATADSQRKYTG